MLIHYLKIAFRNLWKYKMQSVISIIGLAVGFTCFALSVLWIRYEMTFDSFHKNAKQLYVVTASNSFNPEARSINHPYPLAVHLKNTFPEIKETAHAQSLKNEFEIDGEKFISDNILIDAAFVNIFDVKIIAGTLDFQNPDNPYLAITAQKARKLFGNENPIGKKVKMGGDEKIITAIISSWQGHSNYPYDFIYPYQRKNQEQWNSTTPEQTLIELIPDTNVKEFRKKLNAYEISASIEYGSGLTKDLDIVPLNKLHYADPAVSREIHFRHILLFAFAGLLVIVASLFNYITLFISRFRLRNKEFALRLVNAASWSSLFFLLLTELVITLILSAFLGLIMTKIVMNTFLEISAITMNLSTVYLELLLYILFVAVIIVFIFLLILVAFKRRSLNSVIRKKNKNLPRRISLVVQIIISIGFIFCTCVLFKQINYLRHTDLGFSFRNTAVMDIYTDDIKVFENKFKQIPGIEEILSGVQPLLPATGLALYSFSYFDADKNEDIRMEAEEVKITPEYADFYQLRLIGGEMLDEKDSRQDVLINETTWKLFGDTIIGKTFGQDWKVKGVIEDIYRFTPTIPSRPAIYRPVSEDDYSYPNIIIKYRQGTWTQVEAKMKEIVQNDFPEIKSNQFMITNAEDAYDNYLHSENMLMKLLGFVSLVCIIVALFGFISIISLTCEERRKEIAIRKVNGATVKGIIGKYFKEYFLLLLIGACIAFPIAYFIMIKWIENYMHRTNIPFWLYLSIFVGFVLIIIVFIGWKVLKTARENPGEVLKSE